MRAKSLTSIARVKKQHASTNIINNTPNRNEEDSATDLGHAIRIAAFEPLGQIAFNPEFDFGVDRMSESRWPVLLSWT